MTDTLEKRLYDARFNSRADLNTIEQLLKPDVDCNLYYFDPITHTFITPIHLAIRNQARSYTSIFSMNIVIVQLKHNLINIYNSILIIMINQKKKKIKYFLIILLAIFFIFILQVNMNRLCSILLSLLFMIMTGLNEAVRIYVLVLLMKYFFNYVFIHSFKLIIDMIIKPDKDNETLNILINELLHNLETYYFLDGVLQNSRSNPRNDELRTFR